MSNAASGEQPKGLVTRMLEFFGRKPGQTTPEFSAELKALSHEDKVWFANEFNKENMPTVVPPAPAA